MADIGRVSQSTGLPVAVNIPTDHNMIPSGLSPSLEALFSDRLNLPVEIMEGYKRRGVRKHYDWQEECLMQPGVLDGRNLVYCAPTSGGKSFVAEVGTGILMFFICKVL